MEQRLIQHQMDMEKLQLELELVKAKGNLMKSENVSILNVVTPLLRDVIQELTRSVLTSHLPVLEPPVLKGNENPIDYRLWRNAFVALIENRGLSSIEKLMYLLKYVDDDAKECIKGYSVIGTNEAYEQAFKKLEERYGTDYHIYDHVSDTLDNWKPIKGKPKEWLRFADYLSMCELLKQQNTEMKYFDDIIRIRDLASKLPFERFDEWRHEAFDFKEKNDYYPPFSDFVKFVNFEAQVVSSPFSIHRTNNDESEYENNDDAPSENDEQIPSNCLYCKSSMHCLTDCTKFEKRDFGWRMRYVKTNDLCFTCHKHSHFKTSCPDLHTCDKCNQPHPTSMHRENRNQTSTKINPSTDLTVLSHMT